MNPHCSLLAGCALIVTLFSAQGAGAQEAGELDDPHDRVRPLFTLQKHNWKKELQEEGILHYSRTSKFRVGVPLATFGHKGPKLMFTYVPRMPGGQQRKVFLIYLHMDLE